MSAVIVQKTPKLANFINLLLVIALGIFASKLMWLVITPTKTISYQEQELGSEPSQQRVVVNYGKMIAEQHLFGEPKKIEVVKKTTEPKAVKKTAVVTKLNLKLHGIVAYKTKEGFALISSAGGTQKVYKEGEKIQDDVLVSKILPEKVILNNHGKVEELVLPVKQASSQASGRKATPPKPKDLLRHRSALMPPTQNLRDHGNFNLSEFRDEMRSNPAKLMDIARPSPAIVDGEFIGFRVQPGKNRRLFRELGFRPNDIIIEVNGILLDDQSKGIMVLNELSQADEVSVKVKRGQQEIMLEKSF